MQAIELPLFTIDPQENSISNNTSSHISEEKIVTPLTQVLEEITPKSNGSHYKAGETSKALTQSLDELFPEQKHEEKRIQKAKEILGELVIELTPEQLQDITSETQYLVETWIDDFERKIFNGLTLQELLHEKGGV